MPVDQESPPQGPAASTAPPKSNISNLVARLLTAAVAIPILLLAIFAPNPIWVWLIVCWATATGLREWVRMTLPDAPAADRWMGVVVGTANASLMYWFVAKPSVFPISVAGSTMVVFLWFLFRYGSIDKVAARIANTIAGFYYVGLLTFLALLKVHATNGVNDGGWWVLTTLAVAWMSDTGAYFAGRFIGPLWPRKLYETVSPKKTVVGALGGVAASQLALVIAKLWFFPQLTWFDTVAIAVPANVLGQAGDLCESLIKRSVGVKDSGALLPGHGGMLDRVDAVLFVGPYIYAYVTWVLG